jgi:hypothetical protein
MIATRRAASRACLASIIGLLANMTWVATGALDGKTANLRCRISSRDIRSTGDRSTRKG